MEVKINREIRNYTESMFFGLSMRQFVFSILACGVAVGLYFILRPYLGLETLSWICILGAAPFAMLGFISLYGFGCARKLSNRKKSVLNLLPFIMKLLKIRLKKYNREERHD